MFFHYLYRCKQYILRNVFKELRAMNKERRKQIEEVIDSLGELKEQIEAIGSEEQEAFDNLPEGIQYSDRGEAMSENASDLEQAGSDLDDIISSLQEIVER